MPAACGARNGQRCTDWGSGLRGHDDFIFEALLSSRRCEQAADDSQRGQCKSKRMQARRSRASVLLPPQSWRRPLRWRQYSAVSSAGMMKRPSCHASTIWLPRNYARLLVCVCVCLCVCMCVCAYMSGCVRVCVPRGIKLVSAGVCGSMCGHALAECCTGMRMLHGGERVCAHHTGGHFARGLHVARGCTGVCMPNPHVPFPSDLGAAHPPPPPPPSPPLTWVPPIHYHLHPYLGAAHPPRPHRARP